MADGLAGLASGVDTNAIVAQLMALERQKTLRLQARQASIRASDTALKDLQSKLGALRTAAQALRDAGTWADVQTVESSDPARLLATRTGPAGPGAYTVDVLSLASSTQRTYAYTPPAAGDTITIGASSVALAAGATLEDAVAAINAAGAGVHATAVNGQLVLASKTTGAASDFTAVSGTLVEDAAKALAGADAGFTVNGGAVRTASTNVIEDAVAGLKLTLKGTGTVSVTVGEGDVDRAALKDRVKAFVTAYNDVIAAVRAKTTDKASALFGDTGLVGLVSRLRETASPLHELGISTGKGTGGATSADARMGKLVLDEARLDSLLAASAADVRTDLTAFATQLEGLIDTQVGSEGMLDARLESSAAELTRLQRTMSDWDVRLAAKEKRLKAQFAAMEQALGQAQAQSAWLAGQLASLNAQLS